MYLVHYLSIIFFYIYGRFNKRFNKRYNKWIEQRFFSSEITCSCLKRLRCAVIWITLIFEGFTILLFSVEKRTSLGTALEDLYDISVFCLYRRKVSDASFRTALTLTFNKSSATSAWSCAPDEILNQAFFVFNLKGIDDILQIIHQCIQICLVRCNLGAESSDHVRPTISNVDST